MKKGFTLIELLVAIALFTILVTIGVGGFTRALHTQRQVSSLLAAQSNVALALEQMARSIRTGYLFCHDVTDSTPSPQCGCATIGDSGFSEPGANGALPGGDLPVWTCNALDYFNAESNEISYSVQNGSIMETIGGVSSAITGSNVNVRYLRFRLFGNTEADNWTPRVTILMGIGPSSTDPALLNSTVNLETTVSGRGIDCDTTVSPPSC